MYILRSIPLSHQLVSYQVPSAAGGGMADRSDVNHQESSVHSSAADLPVISHLHRPTTLLDSSIRNVFIQVHCVFHQTPKAHCHCLTAAQWSTYMLQCIQVDSCLESKQLETCSKVISDYHSHCTSKTWRSATTEIARVASTVVTPFKVIQGHWFPYQSKARMRLPISERY